MDKQGAAALWEKASQLIKSEINSVSYDYWFQDLQPADWDGEKLTLMADNDFGRNLLKEKYDEIVAFSELGDFIEMPLRSYSSGMITRLAFSIATIVKPDVLIVDEILSVGDAAFQKKSEARMRELMNGGTTVLLVSHSAEQIESLCSRALWLQKGGLVQIGPAYEVCRAYAEAQG